MIVLRVHGDDATPASEPWVAALFHGALPYGERACCCPARAAFAVVVAPSAALPNPPDVLLCAHHTRASHARLEGPGVALYDAAGVIVSGHLAALLAPPDPQPAIQDAEPAAGR